MPEESLEFRMDRDSIVKIKLNAGSKKYKVFRSLCFLFKKNGCFFLPKQRDNFYRKTEF